MDIKAIKELSQKYTTVELEGFLNAFENDGKCEASQKDDPAEIMSDILQSIEVRGQLDKGVPLQDAVRELSKRVRSVLSK